MKNMNLTSYAEKKTESWKINLVVTCILHPSILILNTCIWLQAHSRQQVCLPICKHSHWTYTNTDINTEFIFNTQLPKQSIVELLMTDHPSLKTTFSLKPLLSYFHVSKLLSKDHSSLKTSIAFLE